LDTKREDEIGKTKNEIEGYGQEGGLNGSNKLQNLTQKKRREKYFTLIDKL
jgi:hypothetical protein